MNRTVFFLALIVALLGVQGLSLHAHLPHADDEHTAVQHHNLHVHSHVVDENLDSDHDHAGAVSVDLLTSALSRDHLTPSIDIAFQTVLILASMVVWTCIQRLPRPAPPMHFTPPKLRKCSPRAPPL